jgi:hypothetical protein
MVWEIPRGGNNVRSRAPFEQTAKSPGSPCKEGMDTWAALVEFQEKLAKSQFKTEPISGALLLGAQAVNAESVPFSGRVDHNLVLHFWQVVVMTFVPHIVAKKDAKLQRVGYVLTIPDVADLREFREAFPKVLGSLKADGRGVPPQAARIDVPEQANLEVLRAFRRDARPGTADEHAATRSILRGGETAQAMGLAREAAAESLLQDWSGCVRAVESYHMLKLGNNVKMLSFVRVADRPRLIPEYLAIAKTYRNPLFRAARLRALVREEPWHAGFLELFAEYPWTFFIEGDQTPKYLPRFGRDAKAQFATFQQETYDVTMDEIDNDDERLRKLGLVIQRLVNKYVEGRAEVKTGKKAKEFPKDEKGHRAYTAEFREAQQRVCSDAFLQMRSRHDEDFVEFFTGSICSVPQYLKADEFAFLTKLLMTKPDPNPIARQGLNRDDVKALAMIAVSVCAYNVRTREPQKQGSAS